MISLQKDIETEHANVQSLQSDLRASDERYQSLVRANQEKEVALEATRANQEASEAARVKAEQETCDYQKQLNVSLIYVSKQ